jgi:hypothetical protein
MGWSIGYDDGFERFIGYGVPALCDHPGCNEEIDRGLSYVCGGQPYGGDRGCGLHFCWNHLYADGSLCDRCINQQDSFEPKPDTDEWVNFQATDESWAEWRKENKVKNVKQIRALEKKLKVQRGFWKEAAKA